MPGYGDTGRLNLSCTDIATLDGLQSEFSEIQTTPPSGDASHAAPLMFSEFYLFWTEHVSCSLSVLCSVFTVTCVVGNGFFVQNLTFENKNLDTDKSVSGFGFDEAIVDIRP